MIASIEIPASRATAPSARSPRTGWATIDWRDVLRCGSALSILALTQALAAEVAWSAAISIKGSYHTAVVQKGAIVPNDYNNENTKIEVTYDIKVRIDPRTGEKTWDLENSTATFQNPFPEPLNSNKPFVTEPIPVTEVKGDPKTGTVESFKVKSEKAWDPFRRDQSNGLSGEVDVKNKKGNLKSSYTLGGTKPTITSYTFETDDKKPGQVKRDPATGKPFAATTRMSPGDGLRFDAPTGTLSIVGDTIVETPTADIVLGANVDFPEFQFTGYTTDLALAVFWPKADTRFTVATAEGTLQVSEVPALFYVRDENLFYASLSGTRLAGMAIGSPFHDPSLPDVASPFLRGIDAFLDPDSVSFDPLAVLYVTIGPDLDFDALTEGFTKSAASGAVDLHFVGHPVSEPGTLALVGLAAVGLASRRRSGKRSLGDGIRESRFHAFAAGATMRLLDS